jgi:hypothetical protein
MLAFLVTLSTAIWDFTSVVILLSVAAATAGLAATA